MACGIACVEIEGIDPGELTNWLFNEYRIIVTPIVHDEFQGIRVSPSVYTTGEEIERFVEAMERAVREGLPA
jgi:selenocysteine lyase/cysteine desulfurase